MVYQLKHPVPHKDGDLKEVTLRRARGGDMRAIARERTDTEKTLVLIQNLGGLTPAQVDALDGEDVNALSEIIAGFFGDAPKK